MPLDLWTVEARVHRADAHARELKGAIDAYSELPPWRVTYLEGRGAGREIQRAELSRDLPMEIPIVLSDAIHQARAALDNLVTVLRGSESPGTYVPIRATKDAYDAIAPAALDGVPTWARELIEAMQPFSRDHRRYVGDQLGNWTCSPSGTAIAHRPSTSRC